MLACRLLERLKPNVEDDPAALRRLCAGDVEAGYSSAKLWVLEGVPSGIERIATAILSQDESDFLVPSTHRSRTHAEAANTIFGIAALDTEGISRRCSITSHAIAQLEPTAREREAFLEDAAARSLAASPADPRSLGWNNR